MFDVNAIADQEKEFQLMKDNLKAAGKICHEMKQPLMISMGFLDLLLMEAAELEQSRGKLNSIRSQIQRLSELTDRLMGLTKK